MKPDNEIKEWIDSRDVLTVRELHLFIYGHPLTGCIRNAPFRGWWDYVLRTKNLVDLKQYRFDKINRVTPDIKRAKELILTDPRLKEAGCKKGLKLLANVYGIKIAKNTYIKIKKQYELV